MRPTCSGCVAAISTATTDADPGRSSRNQGGGAERGRQSEPPHRGSSTTIRQPCGSASVDADRAAVQLDDPAGDREAEAAAALGRRSARGRAVEALEDPLGLVGRDARAPRRPPRSARGRRRRRETRTRPPRAMANGVRDEVREHLVEPCSSASPTSRRGPGSTPTRATCRSSASRAPAPRPAASSSSDRSSGTAPDSSFESSSSCSTRPPSRSTCRASSAASAARPGSTPSTRFSSGACSALIGVRSSWETLATRSRRSRSTSASSAAIELNARASSPTSSREVAVTRRP